MCIRDSFYSDGATIHAVNGISYALDEGESLAIVGESGSGTVSYTHLTLPTSDLV